jgi:hypothetical protein
MIRVLVAATLGVAVAVTEILTLRFIIADAHAQQQPLSSLTALHCRKNKERGSIVLPDSFTVSFSEIPPIVQVGNNRAAPGTFTVTGTQLTVMVTAVQMGGTYWLTIRRSDGQYGLFLAGSNMLMDEGWCVAAQRSF